MVKVNNKDSRNTTLTSLWCLYFLPWKYFTPCSIVSIAAFEQVNVCLDNISEKVCSPCSSFSYIINRISLVEVLALK